MHKDTDVQNEAESYPPRAPVVAWQYSRIGSDLNPWFIAAGREADKLRIGITGVGGVQILNPSTDHTDWRPLCYATAALSARGAVPDADVLGAEAAEWIGGAERGRINTTVGRLGGAVAEAIRKHAAPAAVSAPSHAEAAADGWVSVDERLPEPGKPVLLDIGKGVPLRALWAAKHSVEAGDECPWDWAEYDEDSDTYYCPEGWYEWNRYEETHWAVSEKAVAWMNMPLTSAREGSKA